jgi:hypothetical protein
MSIANTVETIENCSNIRSKRIAGTMFLINIDFAGSLGRV